jgi:2-hydroxychromene-2-carboxylate isomerase
MRVAALACTRGVGAAFIFGMSRLAFGGAADLEDHEQYLLAIEETGLTAQEATRAAEHGARWDAELRVLAREMRGLGIAGAPALRWRGRLYVGARAIAPALAQSPSSQPPFDPV